VTSVSEALCGVNSFAFVCGSYLSSRISHLRINATSTFIPVKIAHDFPTCLRIPLNAKKIPININTLILKK
jgi:hypothetical protein